MNKKITVICGVAAYLTMSTSLAFGQTNPISGNQKFFAIPVLKGADANHVQSYDHGLRVKPGAAVTIPRAVSGEYYLFGYVSNDTTTTLDTRCSVNLKTDAITSNAYNLNTGELLGFDSVDTHIADFEAVQHGYTQPNFSITRFFSLRSAQTPSLIGTIGCSAYAFSPQQEITPMIGFYSPLFNTVDEATAALDALTIEKVMSKFNMVFDLY